MDLHKEIGLYHTLKEVFEALNDQEFHKKMKTKCRTTADMNGDLLPFLDFEFVDSVTVPTTNTIFYGPPGTGKTFISIPKAVSLCLNEELSLEELRERREDLMKEYKELRKNGRIEIVTFHQSFAYEEFVEGLRPSTKIKRENQSESRVGFHLEVRDGVFKRMCDKAIKDPSNSYVLVIDEINRANISKVFGELITLIETDKRLKKPNEITVTLPYSEKTEFGVPANLHIIGTMNTADRSIADIDTALRRRFDFEELLPDADRIKSILQLCDGLSIQQFFNRMNERIESEIDREHQIGHSYFIGCHTESEFKKRMNRNVIPLLSEYFFEDRKKIAEVIESKQIDEKMSSFDGCFFEAQKIESLNSESNTSKGPSLRWTVKKEFELENLKTVSVDETHNDS